ncbi:uncharacterized protein LOC118267326 [Spodoptera frugiperda]|uniref:Uncharacterized protein LOC118267326 n=1 Tax=Spodoptera frugiperda TaxID=7108 RepID=A0A9R0EIR1_SPOFR|nr:uncharacterized protein LOC118267326 [Spodoptera frugiperda]
MALVYSCCFWFSLRLGGILTGIISLFQGLVLLVFCCLGHRHPDLVKDEITNWIHNYNLIYAQSYLEDVQADPDKYISLGISFSSIYMIVCVVYIYGAYTCNNMLMVFYILMELLRLIIISVLIATVLLLIKQNNMDIGMLIGASVAGGFLLLGMFYLWICAANLPIVINEMERDEQAAVINKLQQLLEANNPRAIPRGIDSIPFAAPPEDIVNRNIFIVPRQKDMKINNRILAGPTVTKSYTNNFK